MDIQFLRSSLVVYYENAFWTTMHHVMLPKVAILEMASLKNHPTPNTIRMGLLFMLSAVSDSLGTLTLQWSVQDLTVES